MKKILSRTCLVFTAAVSLTVLWSCERTKAITIGIINPNSRLEAVVKGFKSGMSKTGYEEGRNITYVYKGPLPLGRIDRELADLVERKVDLIFVVSTPATRKAKEAVKGTRIPVIFAPVLFPVESGLVGSIEHPGGNLTGIQSGGGVAKALEWHKTVFPGRKTFFVPCVCGDEPAELSMAELEKAARKLGIKLITAEIETLNDLKGALDNIPPEADSLWLLNSPFLVSHTDMFVRAELKHKLPLSSGTSQYEAGVLLSYGQDPFQTGQQASRLAAKILDGVLPGDLPVETSEFFLGINLRTARQIGVSIKDNVLKQADYIVRE